MSDSTCARCGGPGDYGPGLCTSCSCRSCRGAAFFSGDCSTCRSTGLQEAAPVPAALPSLTAEEITRAVERLQAMHQMMVGPQGVAEAELAVHGFHPVSIAHGDAEDAQAAHLIYQWVPQLAEEVGCVRTRIGGNDYTTIVFTTAEAAAVFTAAITSAAPTWWNVTSTAQPVWR